MSLPNVHYLEWNFEQDTVVEYARLGDCCECGACCQQIIEFTCMDRGFGQPNPIEGWHPGNGEFEIRRNLGIVNEISVNGKRRFFHALRVTQEVKPCAMLTNDNRCKIHTGKHLLSRAWPMSPAQVQPFSECTYHFEEVGRWKISELEGGSNLVPA